MCSTHTSATPIQNNVIHTNLQGGFNITLDMLSGKLHTDQDAASGLAHLGGKTSIIIQMLLVRKAWWRNGWLTFS